MESVPLDAVLARCVRAHGLVAPLRSVEEAVVRAAGIYGASPTCFGSCSARVRPFEIRLLEAALYERRSLVRIPAMRHSNYMLPPKLVPHGLAIAAATGGGKWIEPALRRGGVGEAAMRKREDDVESLLAEGRRTATEIRRGLKGWKDPFPGALGLLLRKMAHSGRIVATRVRGTWKSQLYEYALLRDWIGMPPRMPTVEEALRELAPLYFAANGPATLENFAWWTGVGGTMARNIVDVSGYEPVRIEGIEETHYATRSSLRTLDSSHPSGSLSLVPFWDTYLMGQTNRERYLERKWTDRVVDGGGNATNAILRDGSVIGIWDVVDGTLRYAPFTNPPLDGIEEASDRLREIHEFRKVKRVRVPGPLRARGQNAFMSPLRGSRS